MTEEKSLELRELNIFFGKNFLVTVHSQPIRAIKTAERLWREWKDDLSKRGTGLLAYLLMDAVVDDYLPLLDALSDESPEVLRVPRRPPVVIPPSTGSASRGRIWV